MKTLFIVLLALTTTICFASNPQCQPKGCGKSKMYQKGKKNGGKGNPNCPMIAPKS